MTNNAHDNHAAPALDFAIAGRLASVKVVERYGWVVRKDEYVRAPHLQLIGAASSPRVIFVVQVEDHLGEEFITVDQTIDADSSLIRKGDQVIISVPNSIHVETTLRGTWSYTPASNFNCETVRTGKVLRAAEFQQLLCDKNLSTRTALLVISGQGPDTHLICVDQDASEASSKIKEQDQVDVRFSKDGDKGMVGHAEVISESIAA